MILGDPHLLGDSGKETCSAKLEVKGYWNEKLHLPKPGKQFSCQHKGNQRRVISSYFHDFLLLQATDIELNSVSAPESQK